MKQRAKAEFILKWLNKGGITLDLGYMGNEIVGTQLHDFLVKNHNGKIIGVDIQRGAEIEADLNKKTPFKKNSITNIIAADVIEHLLKPFEFLKECHRILKPKGKLILTTPNAISLNHILRGEGKLTEDHQYCWLQYQLRNLIKLAGFDIIKERRANSWTSRWIIFKLFVKIFPKYDAGFQFVCRKR
jgi:2-polyprenyl-3-methyl-5-hydroxy-6-metoxy-1,4-benzoquinol methylase